MARVFTMPNEVIGAIALRLLTAVGLGAAIGFERSYHGRPAGIRTHALVSLASAALMLVPVYQPYWFDQSDALNGATDPTRLAQGIMTGIGFLGAGVIMKDGLSVRGLTTAASIWITAGVGILVGIGFYWPAVLTVAFTLAMLAAFRFIEPLIRTESYALFVVRFEADRPLPQDELVKFAAQFGFSLADVTHRYRRNDATMEYRMTVRTLDPGSITRMSDALRQRSDVAEFRISPTGD
jgi:putative Mg2+ transporter-C (MgtC) family protein